MRNKTLAVMLLASMSMVSSQAVLAENSGDSLSAESLIQFNGAFEQGALVRGQVAPGTEITLEGNEINVDSQGRFAIGFARSAKTEQVLTAKSASDGRMQVLALSIAKRDYKIDRVNGISKKIIKPNPKSQARAAKDGKQVRAARGQFTPQSAFTQEFIWPVTGRISGVYGSQRVYNGKPGNPHYGVDVAVPTGTVIVAPADGVISLSVPDMFYSGGTIILDHGYGVSSSFLHLSKLYVKPGQKVVQGQEIAEVGATGRVTGPHLDWRVNWFQMRLDPVSIVPSMKSVLAKK